VSIDNVRTEEPASAGGGRTSLSGGALDLARRGIGLDFSSVLIATVALVLFVGAFHPLFLHAGELFSTLQGSVYTALIAAGMAYLIAMRELDLSVGSGFALCVVIMALAMKHGVNPWLACLLGIALGGVLGLGNALIVQLFGIPTIVATLATMSIYSGLALAFTNGAQVVSLPVTNSFFTLLGGNTGVVPNSVFVMIAVGIVLTIVLRFTPFGFRVRAIGSNPESSTFSGISIPRVRMQALILIGLLVGVSAALGLAFFESADPTTGTGYELQAIAAAVIGGTPLRGGSTTVAGAIIGAILLTVVASGLEFFSVPVNWSSFATGAAILLAVALDSLVRRHRQRAEAQLGL
jgi:ribose transport system permease protein